jgi:hypothetical protein
MLDQLSYPGLHRACKLFDNRIRHRLVSGYVRHSMG